MVKRLKKKTIIHVFSALLFLRNRVELTYSLHTLGIKKNHLLVNKKHESTGITNTFFHLDYSFEGKC